MFLNLPLLLIRLLYIHWTTHSALIYVKMFVHFNKFELMMSGTHGKNYFPQATSTQFKTFLNWSRCVSAPSPASLMQKDTLEWSDVMSCPQECWPALMATWISLWNRQRNMSMASWRTSMEMHFSEETMVCNLCVFVLFSCVITVSLFAFIVFFVIERYLSRPSVFLTVMQFPKFSKHSLFCWRCFVYIYTSSFCFLCPLVLYISTQKRKMWSHFTCFFFHC